MLALVTHMQGNLSECLAHYSNAFMLAEEIGDRAFMSWVVAERAAVAWSVGNATAVLRLTETFVDKTRGANRANMVSNTAQAFARTGDYSRAKSFISEAETLAHTIPDGQNSDLPGTPIWGFSPSSTITNTAIAWLNLREPRRALESAQNAVLLLGDQGLYRHSAHAKMIVATSYAALGEPEEASRLATDVILSSPQDVYIVSGQSLDLLQALRKYRSSPAVRQLHEVMSHYENKLEEGS
jgi:tetratricopeptide (TPR) repeat protein